MFNTWKKLNHTQKIKYSLIALVIITAFLRLYRLDYPPKYVFDEVYHGFTAKEYLKANPAAWDPFATPPPNVAYEWTHPPLAKEIMTTSMFLLRSSNNWAFRLPGVILGTISVFLVFYLTKLLFKNDLTAFIAAFIFAFDGLNFVQSRTGMNDAYLVCFMLASLVLFFKKKIFSSSIFLGLALASKWTAIYILGFYGVFFLIQIYQQKRIDQNTLKYSYYILVPPIIYLLSYIPYFLSGYNFDNFKELQRQMWVYHTHLKATHNYASPWWSWPLNLFPVWYFVDYFPDGSIANIFASGNPAVFWLGTGALIVTIWDTIKKHSLALFAVILGFLVFWLPWAFAPRIMFLYHFSPSVPFLSIALSYQIGSLQKEKGFRLTLSMLLILIILSFLIYFPMLTAIPLPKELMQIFFKTNLTTNPFGS